MLSPAEVEKLALELPEDRREALASQILDPLPPGLSDEDEGVTEALRRYAEFVADPSVGVTLSELKQLSEQAD